MTQFAERLKKAGVSVDTVSIDNYQHGPIAGKEPNPDYPALDAKIYGFFEKHLDRKE
jgi:hypothetical protein